MRTFQFTHPYGVRRQIDLLHLPRHHVSIHAPVRGATRVLAESRPASAFQFTHPYGVRPPVHVWTFRKNWFQFTHPYGVRLKMLLRSRPVWYVSIHAPVRSATLRARRPGGAHHVSIHAPVRGATIIAATLLPQRSFNSRTRTGYDMRIAPTPALYQSFNSRTRRVRLLVRSFDPRTSCSFNSRTRTGCDVVVNVPLMRIVTFQFTHPYGVRLSVGMNLLRRIKRFQFTHPYGVRLHAFGNLADVLNVSIHVPARGATRPSRNKARVRCFNSRTRTGATEM